MLWFQFADDVHSAYFIKNGFLEFALTIKSIQIVRLPLDQLTMLSEVAGKVTLTEAILEYDPRKIVRGDKTVDETLEAGEAVCIGVDITPQNCRCLLCNYSCSF